MSASTKLNARSSSLYYGVCLTSKLLMLWCCSLGLSLLAACIAAWPRQVVMVAERLCQQQHGCGAALQAAAGAYRETWKRGRTSAMSSLIS